MGKLTDSKLQSPNVSDAGNLEQRIATLAAGSDSVRETAYCKWEEAGCPCGDGVDFWLQAEAELAAKAELAKTN